MTSPSLFPSPDPYRHRRCAKLYNKEKKTVWGNSTISPNIFFFLHFFSSFSEPLPKSEGKKRCWIWDVTHWSAFLARPAGPVPGEIGSSAVGLQPFAASRGPAPACTRRRCRFQRSAGRPASCAICRRRGWGFCRCQNEDQTKGRWENWWEVLRENNRI